MKKQLHLRIFDESVVLPELARIVGKHNGGKQLVTLGEIDLILFAMQKHTLPEYNIGVRYEGETQINIYENDTLVCSIEEREMYTLEQEENVCVQRYENFKMEEFLKQ